MKKRWMGILLALVMVMTVLPLGAVTAHADADVDTRIDNSVDRSTTEVIGRLTLTDTRTGEVQTDVVVFDETTASTFTDPSNPTVTAMISEAQEALLDKAQELAGGSTVTTVSQSVSDPAIESWADNRTYNYFDNVDNGESGKILIVDGNYYHNWRYTVTLEAEYDSSESASASSHFGVLISDTAGNANSGGGYRMDYPGNEFGTDVRKSATNNFVENGGHVVISAVPDDGYTFAGWYQGNPNAEAGEPIYSGEPLSTNSTYEFYAPLNMSLSYLCAVFEEGTTPAHPGDQVQMWVGNTEVVGPDSSAQGGKVAVRYTPSYDDYPDIKAKDGTNYVAGEVLQFYRGDECTVYARPDAGYHFVGWYHVNIEWGPGETLAWQGSVISTETSFTYKPGVTVLPGDTEPLRYVCAVFEAGEEETASAETTAYTVISGGGASRQAGSGMDLAFTVERTPDNADAFTHFAGIEVDGAAVDDANYTAVSGSVNLTLKASYLETLAVGQHTLKVLFNDGSVETTFTVTAAEGSSGTTPSGQQPQGAVSPQTGDGSPIRLWTGLMALGFAGTVIALAVERKKHNA